jgi:hypothetical protein
MQRVICRNTIDHSRNTIDGFQKDGPPKCKGLFVVTSYLNIINNKDKLR